jgi:hypothetical protein
LYRLVQTRHRLCLVGCTEMCIIEGCINESLNIIYYKWSSFVKKMCIIYYKLHLNVYYRKGVLYMIKSFNWKI